MKLSRGVIAAVLVLGAVLCMCGTAIAQIVVYPGYPPARPDPNDAPQVISISNAYIRADIGKGGTVLAYAHDPDGTCSDIDKTGAKNETSWSCNGRYAVVLKEGDPEVTNDNDRELICYGNIAPCHYFGYWKLRIGEDMRMIGDTANGHWYKEPELHKVPPPELAEGRQGGFIEGIWSTNSATGTEIRCRIRMSVVRDQVRFEYTIMNMAAVGDLKTENVGFEQNGDVEVADAINGNLWYYEDLGTPFVTGFGQSQPLNRPTALVFGGLNNPPVPDQFEIYDDIQNPMTVARNTLGGEDCTKPDYAAIGEYSELHCQAVWLPLNYHPDPLHNVGDPCWVLCWDQKTLSPGASRTIVTYYGVGAATSRWTYKSGQTTERDHVVLAVQAPRSLKYDSTNVAPMGTEIAPSVFNVKAYVYNMDTDPGPYDLRDASAFIHLPPGLELVDEGDANLARKDIGLVPINTEAAAVEWHVRATGDYAGELPIYVTVTDNDTTGIHWQQTVVRKIIVPASKSSQFRYNWQLMHVPFNFNNYRLSHVFNLQDGGFGARYYDADYGIYKPLQQIQPGQAFWMYVGGMTFGQTQSFTLASDAAIVGEISSKQTEQQLVHLKRGWNLFGNPLVYPVYWGQVMVYLDTPNKAIPVDAAVSKKWITATLFCWNSDKWDYDVVSGKETLLNPWKGYWIYTRQPVTLVFRPPLFPSSDVTSLPNGY